MEEKRHTGEVCRKVLVGWQLPKGGNPQCWVDRNPTQNLKA